MDWSEADKATLLALVLKHGHQWQLIAEQLPGSRTRSAVRAQFHKRKTTQARTEKRRQKAKATGQGAYEASPVPYVGTTPTTMSQGAVQLLPVAQPLAYPPASISTAMTTTAGVQSSPPLLASAACMPGGAQYGAPLATFPSWRPTYAPTSHPSTSDAPPPMQDITQELETVDAGELANLLDALSESEADKSDDFDCVVAFVAEHEIYSVECFLSAIESRGISDAVLYALGRIAANMMPPADAPWAPTTKPFKKLHILEPHRLPHARGYKDLLEKGNDAPRPLTLRLRSMILSTLHAESAARLGLGVRDSMTQFNLYESGVVFNSAGLILTKDGADAGIKMVAVGQMPESHDAGAFSAAKFRKEMKSELSAQERAQRLEASTIEHRRIGSVIENVIPDDIAQKEPLMMTGAALLRVASQELRKAMDATDQREHDPKLRAAALARVFYCALNSALSQAFLYVQSELRDEVYESDMQLGLHAEGWVKEKITPFGFDAETLAGQHLYTDTFAWAQKS